MRMIQLHGLVNDKIYFIQNHLKLWNLSDSIGYLWKRAKARWSRWIEYMGFNTSRCDFISRCSKSQYVRFKPVITWNMYYNTGVLLWYDYAFCYYDRQCSVQYGSWKHQKLSKLKSNLRMTVQYCTQRINNL